MFHRRVHLQAQAHWRAGIVSGDSAKSAPPFHPPAKPREHRGQKKNLIVQVRWTIYLALLPKYGTF